MRRFGWSPVPVLLCTGCATGTSLEASAPPRTETRGIADRISTPKLGEGAAGSVQDRALRALLEAHWQLVLESDPLYATALGVRSLDHRIPSRTLESRNAIRGQKRNLIRALEALDPQALSESDAVTRKLLIEELATDVATSVCRFEDWSLSPRGNPVTTWNYLPQLHRIDSTQDFENLLARYRAIPKSIDEDIENLRRGIRDGLYANRESTRRVLDMADKQLQSKTDDWPLFEPARTLHPEVPEEDRARIAEELEQVVLSGIRPALERYRDLVRDEILPKARSSDETGLSAFDFGRACYAARIRRFTTLPVDAQTLHDTGLQEIERIDRAMAALGQKVFGLEDRMAVLKKLRSDPSLHFDTAEAVESKAKSALDAAKARIPEFFGILPKADCVIRRVPSYEAPYTTIAYYRQPSPDGTKPGEYFVNVHAPKTRPRYEAEALAFHESIPGHHLQIAIAQELPALPEFRKHLGMTVFVEGWALYTEQLADEMGLYSSDVDRMGMLSYEAWRAARLVVDTGLHAFGWSREKAKSFMEAHTALAPNNIDNEVDRYIAWPGQALAYKTGQLEIWKLRRSAEARLGESFDIKGFHDTVLGGGAVTLSVLQDRVRAWIANLEDASPSSAAL